MEEFDLVIVDMLMPGLNGLGTIEELQRLRPSQKVLIASGYAPEQMDALAKARGLAWLPKPYSVAALAAAVRTVLEGSTAHSSSLAAS
jgi:two-component system cell cycle sensor histidine kinase/response regulator CckA